MAAPSATHHQSDDRDSRRSLAGRAGEAAAWVALIAAAAIFFWFAQGSRYQQLSLGVLCASVVLVVLTVLFEAAWALVTGVREPGHRD
jgi:uncharacterized membrane protein YgcG